VGWVFREWKGLPRVKKSFHEWKNADVVGKSILEAWCPSNPGVYPNRVFFQSGYSSLTILNDGTIGCAYENGEFEEYQIYFVRLSLDWLTDGKDSYQRPNDILRK
jgi:hypothetical protein